MWHNSFNNNEEYYREDREREREQWEDQTFMESFNQRTTISMLQLILDNQTSQHEEMKEWNHQNHYEPQNEDMEYGWDCEYQYEPSNVEMEYGWSHEHHYETSNEEIGYVEGNEHQQESFDPYTHYQDASIENHQEEDLNMVLLQKLLDGQDRMEERFAEMDSKVDGAYNELSARINTLTDHYKALEDQVSKADGEIEEILYEEDSVQEGEIEEISIEEDTVQESSDVSPEDYDVVDQRQEYCTHTECLYKDEEEISQLHEDVLSEDVQNALFPIEEEIEEILKDVHTTLEDEEEIAQLHQDQVDEDTLASMLAMTNEATLWYNQTSTEYAKDKEEEVVVQLFELSQKELREDEVAEQRIPGSPTPRLQHPQCPRKRCEWKIKPKWREKPSNV